MATLAECDLAAADLAREYQKHGQFACVIRTFDVAGNVRVICPKIDASIVASYLNKAADVLFDGSGVQSREVG